MKSMLKMAVVAVAVYAILNRVKAKSATVAKIVG